MSILDPTQKVSFHDASLTRMLCTGDRIRLRISDVWVGDDNGYDADVELRGVREMTRDDEVVTTLCMEAEDAEVLLFEQSGHTVRLVVTWISHENRTDTTRSYKFNIAGFDIMTEKHK